MIILHTCLILYLSIFYVLPLLVVQQMFPKTEGIPLAFLDLDCRPRWGRVCLTWWPCSGGGCVYWCLWCKGWDGWSDIWALGVSQGIYIFIYIYISFVWVAEPDWVPKPDLDSSLLLTEISWICFKEGVHQSIWNVGVHGIPKKYCCIFHVLCFVCTCLGKCWISNR